MLCIRGMVSKLRSISMYRVCTVFALRTPGRGGAEDLTESSRLRPALLVFVGLALPYWSFACEALRWTGFEIWCRGAVRLEPWRPGRVSALDGCLLMLGCDVSEEPPESFVCLPIMTDNRIPKTVRWNISPRDNLCRTAESRNVIYNKGAKETH